LLSFFNFGDRWGLVVNATPRALYPRERPGTNCTGGWVGPSAGVDGCRKSRFHADFFFRSPDRPARSESLYQLSYPGPEQLASDTISCTKFDYVHYSFSQQIIFNSILSSKNFVACMNISKEFFCSDEKQLRERSKPTLHDERSSELFTLLKFLR